MVGYEIVRVVENCFHDTMWTVVEESVGDLVWWLRLDELTIMYGSIWSNLDSWLTMLLLVSAVCLVVMSAIWFKAICR